MKAMTCPQCGALIKEVSLKDKFADCDYCEAKILLRDNKDRIVEISDQEDGTEELTPWEQYRENYRKIVERSKRYDEPYTYPVEPKKVDSAIKIFAVFGGIVLFAAAGFIGLAGMLFSTSSNKNVSTSGKTANSPAIKYPTPTPAPQINYEVKVQWNGKYDMEHFENPQIDTSKLPTTDISELKKTVFKNRAVEVRITIDTEGEVMSAEAISGHPILKEAAVNAARKSRFNQREKLTTRVLTYYFNLIAK